MAGEQAAETNFEFVGSGGEYFRIWIVNLLLTVLTLGIYSAWAKVRREQYFHRNTLLAGSGFDYHGKPGAILKGRLIAWGAVVVLTLAQKFSIGLYGILVLVALPFLPWLLLRSIKFRAGNTSYRGLRFRHRGSYREALVAFIGHGLLTVVTLGLWMPLWMRAMKRFQLGRLSFGATDFECAPRAGGFYGAYFLAGLLLILPGVAAAVIIPMVSAAKGGMAMAGYMMLGAVPLVLFLAFMLLIRPLLEVRLANLTWNATSLGGRRFVSTQSLRTYVPVLAVNLLLTVLTLGLYWPWAKVRVAAYRLSHLAFDGTDLDASVAAAEAQTSAIGEEIADVFDLDIAL